MGNINSQDRKQTPRLNNSESLESIVAISHPKLAYGKIVYNNSFSNGGYILLSMSIPSKMNYIAWEQKIKKYKPIDLQLPLMLPKQFKFTQEGFCGSAGTLQVKYDLYPFIFADQLQNRRDIQKYFEQPQLWYIIYTFIQTAATLHKKGNILGDVRPQTTFINKNGQLMLGNLCTFLQEQTNYEKTKLNREITYLAPQIIKQLQEGSQPTSNVISAQCFSIGLTLMDSFLLSDSNDLYTTQLNFRSKKLNQRVKQVAQTGMQNQIMIGIITSLCHPDPVKRLTAQQAYNVLKPYQNDILNLNEFTFQNVDQYLQSKIFSTLKKQSYANKNMKMSKSNYSWKNSQQSKQQQAERNNVYIDHGDSTSQKQEQINKKKKVVKHNNKNNDNAKTKQEFSIKNQQISTIQQKKQQDRTNLKDLSSINLNLNDASENNINTNKANKSQNNREVLSNEQKFTSPQNQYNIRNQQNYYQQPIQSFNHNQLSPNKVFQNQHITTTGYYPPPPTSYYSHNQYLPYHQYLPNNSVPFHQQTNINQQYPYKQNSNFMNSNNKINYPFNPYYSFSPDPNLRPMPMTTQPSYYTDIRDNISIRYVSNIAQNQNNNEERQSNINNRINSEMKVINYPAQTQLNEDINKNTNVYSTGQKNYSRGLPEQKYFTQKKQQNLISQQFQTSISQEKRQPVNLNSKGPQKYSSPPVKNKQMVYSFENLQKQKTNSNIKDSVSKTQYNQDQLYQKGRAINYIQKSQQKQSQIKKYNKGIQQA